MPDPRHGDLVNFQSVQGHERFDQLQVTGRRHVHHPPLFFVESGIKRNKYLRDLFFNYVFVLSSKGSQAKIGYLLSSHFSNSQNQYKVHSYILIRSVRKLNYIPT